MAVLIIFPVILQKVINIKMLPNGKQGKTWFMTKKTYSLATKSFFLSFLLQCCVQSSGWNTDKKMQKKQVLEKNKPTKMKSHICTYQIYSFPITTFSAINDNRFVMQCITSLTCVVRKTCSSYGDKMLCCCRSKAVEQSASSSETNWH